METATSQRSSKKRTRPAGSDDGGEGKKRGRPRVDRQDDISAADRRRRQIREAQRAYRQRKESTLDELRKRVSDLSSTMEQMNTLFEDCSHRLGSLGLSDLQAAEITATMLKVSALTEIVRNPPDDVSSISPRTYHPKPVSPPPEPAIPIDNSLVARNVPGWLDQTVLAAPSRDTRQFAYMGLVNVTAGDPEPNLAATDMFRQQLAANPTQNIGRLASTGTNLYDAVSIPQSMPAPTTYSFQETTFGRRLHRACIEAGYQLLLTGPSRSPLTYERVFKLALMGTDLEKKIAAFRKFLEAGVHDDLDIWTSPLSHVGGAGTHYPKIDAFGNVHPRSRWSGSAGIYGPYALTLLAQQEGVQITPDMMVELAGYDGEWFDPYDVEGYLLEKGIRLESAASFIECEIVDWQTSSRSTSTISGARSPMTPDSLRFSTAEATAPFDREQMSELEKSGINVKNWHDGLEITGVGLGDAMTSPPWFDGATSIPTQDQMRMAGIGTRFDLENSMRLTGPKKRTVIVDVAKLVKTMVHSCACLGRSCGFKRRDVDRALALASFEPY